jgi:8-oxo-dGTP diphosphatase
LKETRMSGPHRPAQLFRFDTAKYEKLKRKGLLFEL